METNIAIVGDEYFVVGFQLAGVKRTVIADEATINKKLEAVLDRKDIGIVIMQHTDFEKLNQRLKDRAMTQVKPTVVVLSHDTSAEENLRLMIKRSLGIDLWSKENAHKSA
ncbi:MAG: V-type ATP synthase subunit F [Nanoarchaeota archaeon]|nr:V-type ATP synthase subunit F [Nanoarchaeota archaeon]